MDLGFWANNGVLARSNAQVRGKSGGKSTEIGRKFAKMGAF